jgi:hypothetical protein
MLHPFNKSARRRRLFVARGPEQQFEHYGREGDALRRKPVVDFAAVLDRLFGNDDAGSLQLSQPVGQNVGGDTFARARRNSRNVR